MSKIKSFLDTVFKKESETTFS